VPLALLTIAAEAGGNPALHGSLGHRAGRERDLGGRQHGGQGGPLRHGEFAIWAAATTAASNGSVNSMHDSFTPLGGSCPLWLMQLGEIVFGGVGSGLYGLIVYAIIAVFIAGLMVGRTPEYLGKKIEAFEMKMASLVILLPSAAVLDRHRIACACRRGHGHAREPGRSTASARSSTRSPRARTTTARRSEASR
jgi:K+-transporting ATPase ATPase A chain